MDPSLLDTTVNLHNNVKRIRYFLIVVEYLVKRFKNYNFCSSYQYFNVSISDHSNHIRSNKPLVKVLDFSRFWQTLSLSPIQTYCLLRKHSFPTPAHHIDFLKYKVEQLYQSNKTYSSFKVSRPSHRVLSLLWSYESYSKLIWILS